MQRPIASSQTPTTQSELVVHAMPVVPAYKTRLPIEGQKPVGVPIVVVVVLVVVDETVDVVEVVVVVPPPQGQFKVTF